MQGAYQKHQPKVVSYFLWDRFFNVCTLWPEKWEMVNALIQKWGLSKLLQFCWILPPGITQMSFALQTLMNVRVETPAVPSTASTIQEATNAAVRKAFGSVQTAVDVMVNSCYLMDLLMWCATGGRSLEAMPFTLEKCGVLCCIMWQPMYFRGSYFEEPEISVSGMKTAIGLGSKWREVHNKGKVQAWCST